MKILFISMHSIHAIRWIENLKESEYELYWYDVLGQGELKTLSIVKQFVNTSKRRIPYVKGEFWLSKKNPSLYEKIRPFLEITENKALEKIIKEIKPDIIHSFEMQSCAYPILKTLNKFPKIKWIYSCWGNDLYYYQNLENHKHRIKTVLKRVNYLHTDCFRDYKIAKELGFNGEFLGVIPGGTGYKLKELEAYKQSIDRRKIILVKGYQNIFGRALNVVKALEKLEVKIDQYKVVVFGGHPEVESYIFNNNLNYKIYGRHDLSHQQMIELMGQSLIYIGNNISDGMANTLLEAIIMGVFPIQSNPGNVSAEIIEDGINGFLIEDPEDIDLISGLIAKALENYEIIAKAQKKNESVARERLDYWINQQKVLNIYMNLELNL